MNKETSLEKLAKECISYIECDTARISKPQDRMYLIIGYNKNTKDNEGCWIDQEGKRIDFNYVEEKIVASGSTKKELIKSLEEYKRLCNITWEQYFKELTIDNT